MVWCHNNKLIFIHVPKTGGTTVEHSLKLMENMHGYCVVKNTAFQHFNWNDYNTFLGSQIYNTYHKFSIVRHPVDRFISEYYWTPLPFGYKNNASFDNFLDTVENIVANNKFYDSLYHDHFQSQSYYILDKNNEIRVDKLFKFERFHEVTTYLSTFTDKPIEAQNKNNVIDKIVPTDSQLLKIYEIYKEDFINFNYKLNI